MLRRWAMVNTELEGVDRWMFGAQTPRGCFDVLTEILDVADLLDTCF